MSKNLAEANIRKSLENKTLTVFLTEDANCWIAQSLEVYYVAYGKTANEAKDNFEKGFYRTIEENMKRLGNIEGFINTKAPVDTWREFDEIKNKCTKSLKTLDLCDDLPSLHLDYMDLRAA